MILQNETSVIKLARLDVEEYHMARLVIDPFGWYICSGSVHHKRKLVQQTRFTLSVLVPATRVSLSSRFHQ